MEEGLIGRELYDNLSSEYRAELLSNEQPPPLDLGLRSEEMLKSVPLFEHLDQPQLTALARFFSTRLALPDEKIVKRGGPGDTDVLYLVRCRGSRIARAQNTSGAG